MQACHEDSCISCVYILNQETSCSFNIFSCALKVILTWLPIKLLKYFSTGQTPPCQASVINQSALTSATNHSPARPSDSSSTMVTSPVAPELSHPSAVPITTIPNPQMAINPALPAVGTFVHSPVDTPMMSPSPTLQVPPTCQVNGQPPLMIPNTYAMSQQGVIMQTIANMNPVPPMTMAMHHSFHESMQQMQGSVPYQMSCGGPMVHMHPVPVTTLPMPPPLQPIVSSGSAMPHPMVLHSGIQDLSPVSVPTSTTVQLLPTAPLPFSSHHRAVESSMRVESPVKVKVEPNGSIENDDEISVGQTVTVVTQTTDAALKSSPETNKVQVRDVPPCSVTRDSTNQGTNETGQEKDLSEVKSTE